MNKKYNKGFTLIELLVVIAMIGILSGVILVNLGGESDKARDARTKSGLNQIRTNMESLRAGSSNLAYPTWASATATTGEVTKIKNDIAAQGSALRIHSSSTVWCAEATLKNGTQFCVDSTGYAGDTANCSYTAGPPVVIHMCR